MWEDQSDTILHKAELFCLKMNNPYMHYYLDQQHGWRMPLCRGSLCQRGHGQMGYDLGTLLGGLARAAKPMLRSGAKALGKIALTSGVNLLGDVLAGKNIKEAPRACALEGVNVAKMNAVQRTQRYAQTEQGRKWSRTHSRSTRCSKSVKRTAKKRKACLSRTRRKQAKWLKTSPRDIFG